MTKVNGVTKKRKHSENSGRFAEFVAILLLTFKGYLVLNNRYRTHYGEIDIIALKGKQLVFIEVKLRHSLEAARFAASKTQMARIKNAANSFCKSRQWCNNKIRRFDVIACAPYKIPKHIKNAF